MSKSSILLGSLATIVIIELSLFLYLNTEELKRYKKESSLKNQFKTTENIGRMIVTAKTNDSRNIQVGEIINEYSKKIDEDLSIYYKDLTTDESIILEGDKKYYMASLYKIILTLFLLDDLETSVKNIGTLFENIALSLNTERAHSEYILKLLQNQTLTSKLPKYLPSSVYSHNKTGELNEYSHDAGIFYTPKANYVLVFMSKTQDPKSTNEQMALMSKEIYESLNGL